jgi:predicted DNA-binding transcriptional regulator YafY
MPEAAARLLRLLGLLQRRPYWSGPELADRLGVGVRTLRRDAERLRGLGYLVESAPGPGGGYRLGVGTDLPPLLLDDEEAMAVAVVLGVSASAAIPGIERPALATLDRIDRLLPPRLRTQLAALRATTVALSSPRQVVVPPERLILLARACDGCERAVFGYRTRYGAEAERRVEPHRLVATERLWYLVAHDLDRADWRTFRVDRMADVRLTGHTFVPRPLDDPARLVAESIAVAPYRYQARVRVRAPAGEVGSRVAPSVAVITPEGPEAGGPTGACILELGAESLDWIAGYLVELGLDFEVLEPPELRDHLAQLGLRLVGAHQDDQPPARPDCR